MRTLARLSFIIASADVPSVEIARILRPRTEESQRTRSEIREPPEGKSLARYSPVSRATRGARRSRSLSAGSRSAL